MSESKDPDWLGERVSGRVDTGMNCDCLDPYAGRDIEMYAFAARLLDITVQFFDGGYKIILDECGPREAIIYVNGDCDITVVKATTVEEIASCLSLER